MKNPTLNPKCLSYLDKVAYDVVEDDFSRGNDPHMGWSLHKPFGVRESWQSPSYMPRIFKLPHNFIYTFYPMHKDAWYNGDLRTRLPGKLAGYAAYWADALELARLRKGLEFPVERWLHPSIYKAAHDEGVEAAYGYAKHHTWLVLNRILNATSYDPALDEDYDMASKMVTEVAAPAKVHYWRLQLAAGITPYPLTNECRFGLRLHHREFAEFTLYLIQNHGYKPPEISTGSSVESWGNTIGHMDVIRDIFEAMTMPS